MHDEILSKKQLELLPLIERVATKEFGLVGGTAIALQVGHRRSIDFDLATLNNLRSDKVRELIREHHSIESTLVDEQNELSIAVNSVKLTVFKYPFPISFEVIYKKALRMPDLLTLSAMKAFALGRRAKWKDYVDLYFIFKKYSLSDLVDKAKKIFKEEFNELLFREQIAFFEDIDHSEEIDYLPGYEMSDEEIKKTLVETSLQK